ncbi:response regulator transcription factor [Kribbella sp. NPDC051952]|uniref:response regulator transcription factor n=1 Tax=Kribbella sp. NPDC051952 TaxID=3154851 RepID=UPI0034464EB1
MIRVLLVDDDPLVRMGLRTMLGGVSDLVVAGEADDGAGVRELVASARPDVVLMDLKMPGTDGITATAAVRESPDPPAVIVLTTYDADDQVLRALRAGAAGFVLKHTPPADIVDAIRRAANGEPVLSPSVLAGLIEHVTSPDRDRDRRDARELLGTLTDRERAIATAIAQGRTNREIAGELYLSTATVKAHLTRLMAKLEVSNRTQVAVLLHDAE